MSAPEIVSETISLVVNGQPQTTTARTLHDWVCAQGVQPAALATAVNGHFVPRDQRVQCLLRADDLIVTFQPIQGG
jgi:sulfur carrier protein